MFRRHFDFISGPELCLGNVVDEERNRLRISDYRVVFLRLPPEEKDQMRNVKNFISKLFKEALFVEIMKNDTLIKIGFKNWYGKKRALEYAYERQLVWPNTQSRLTFQDPEKQNMGYNSMGTCGILMQEGIANELLFLNFKLVTGNMRLNMELTSSFPGLDDYRLDTEKNQLVLVFKYVFYRVSPKVLNGIYLVKIPAKSEFYKKKIVKLKGHLHFLARL